MLNSLVDIAKTQKLSEKNVNDLINSMFQVIIMPEVVQYAR